MKNWKKILGLGLSAALSLSLLASCGGGATTESAAPSAPAESQAVESQGAESAAPAELKTVEAGKLHMSTNAAFPPYEMTTDNGGFEERKAVMDFSDTYATGIQVIIVKEGSDVTLDTLGDQLIGTQRGTTGETYCTDDYGADHVVPYDNGITAVQALMNDQVDCVVIDSAPASEFVAANPGLVILDTEYTNEDYAIGFAKGNTALLEAVNGALAELTADGTVQSILDKYIVAE